MPTDHHPRRALIVLANRYWVRVGEQTLIVNQPDPGSAPTFAGTVCLTLHPERVHVIAEAQ